MGTILLIVITLVTAVFLVGQAKAKELPELVVKSLVVVDKNGEPRVILEADDGVNVG